MMNAKYGASEDIKAGKHEWELVAKVPKLSKWVIYANVPKRKLENQEGLFRLPNNIDQVVEMLEMNFWVRDLDRKRPVKRFKPMINTCLL